MTQQVQLVVGPSRNCVASCVITPASELMENQYRRGNFER